MIEFTEYVPGHIPPSGNLLLDGSAKGGNPLRTLIGSHQRMSHLGYVTFG
jgi:hypothetical protein